MFSQQQLASFVHLRICPMPGTRSPCWVAGAGAGEVGLAASRWAQPQLTLPAGPQYGTLERPGTAFFTAAGGWAALHLEVGEAAGPGQPDGCVHPAAGAFHRPCAAGRLPRERAAGDGFRKAQALAQEAEGVGPAGRRGRRGWPLPGSAWGQKGHGAGSGFSMVPACALG